MPEEFGLDQFVRNGGHVQRDEGHVRPRRVAVQCLGDEFLAGAGLTVDEDRDVRIRQTADSAEDLLHSGCLPDDLGRHRRFVDGERRALFLRVSDRSLHHRDRIIHVEGLRQVFEGAGLVGGHGRFEIRMRRHDDYRYLRPLAMQALQ